jgi:hypothetical protein
MIIRLTTMSVVVDLSIYLLQNIRYKKITLSEDVRLMRVLNNINYKRDK